MSSYEQNIPSLPSRRTPALPNLLLNSWFLDKTLALAGLLPVTCLVCKLPKSTPNIFHVALPCNNSFGLPGYDDAHLVLVNQLVYLHFLANWVSFQPSTMVPQWETLNDLSSFQSVEMLYLLQGSVFNHMFPVPLSIYMLPKESLVLKTRCFKNKDGLQLDVGRPSQYKTVVLMDGFKLHRLI